jgi:2-keto-3-deoxy-L-rhamnonate aldolase RhmA
VRDNHTKRLLAAGRPALGVSLTIADSFVAEVVGAAGFDFVMIDTEHAPFTIEALQNVLIALRTSGSTVFVRPAANDATLIKQILDLGAEGLVVPEIADGDSCAAAVSAARYPPGGTRGFGPRRAARLEGGRAEYLRRSDDEIAVVAMVEHVDAIDHLDEILTTPGLDGIMAGPADLAVSMGHLHELSHPEVAAALDRVFEACERNHKPFGVFAAAEQAARSWVSRGACFVTIGSDLQFLDQGVARSTALAEELRAAAVTAPS